MAAMAVVGGICLMMIPFLIGAEIFLIVLKVAVDAVTLPWIWVFTPLWLPLAIIAATGIVMSLGGVVINGIIWIVYKFNKVFKK